MFFQDNIFSEFAEFVILNNAANGCVDIERPLANDEDAMALAINCAAIVDNKSCTRCNLVSRTYYANECAYE